MAVTIVSARLCAGLAIACLVPGQSVIGQSIPASVARGASAFAQTGDQVRITVWPQASFGPPVTGTVDPFGNIVVPPIGVLGVARIPIGQLRDSLIQRIGKYIRDPEVDVQVLRRVTVNGAVLRPDIYFMDVSANLRDVIARAGGISEVGNRNKVSVIRDGVSRRVKDWETDTTQASVLRSGDQVVVGRQSWIAINIIPVASLSLATASFLLSLRHR